MAGASALTGLIGKKGASDAADDQTDAAADQQELAREMWEYQKKALKPYRGKDYAQNALMYDLGLGPAPTIGGVKPSIERYQRSAGNSNGQGFRDWALDEYGSLDWENDPGRWGFDENLARAKWAAQNGGGGQPEYGYRVGDQEFDTRAEAKNWANNNREGGTTYGGYQKTPGYDFRLNEGRNAVEASVSQRHGLNSGATLKAMEQYGQNFATGEYNNHINRLTGMANTNMNAALGQVGASNQYAQSGMNAMANTGNANAAGAIGGANALVGGINNGIGTWAYGKQAGWG